MSIYKCTSLKDYNSLSCPFERRKPTRKVLLQCIHNKTLYFKLMWKEDNFGILMVLRTEVVLFGGCGVGQLGTTSDWVHFCIDLDPWTEWEVLCWSAHPQAFHINNLHMYYSCWAPIQHRVEAWRKGEWDMFWHPAGIWAHPMQMWLPIVSFQASLPSVSLWSAPILCLLTSNNWCHLSWIVWSMAWSCKQPDD